MRRALLCHRCRRPIGSDESICPWCGAARPASRWHGSAWSRGVLDGDWLVTAIITVSIVFYLLSLFMSPHRNLTLHPFRFLAPDQNSLLVLGATGTIPIDRFGRIWTLLSANYLHGGILHILFNMMALRQIAPWVTHEYGPSRMFTIYTLGGVCGYIVSYFAGIPFTIGASAAVCSLIGALLYFGKSRGGAHGAMVFREVSGWVFSLVLFGFIMPGINNWAHGGGILGGVLCGMLLGYNERRPESAGHRYVALACAAATVGVLCWAAYIAMLLWFGQR